VLAHRIIPTILVRNGHLVKGQQFKADRICGNALQAARIHAMRGVDEILILDVAATQDGREPDYEMIQKLTETARVPVTVGGGINSIEHVQKLLNAGADKVCIGRAQGSINRIAKKFGRQCVVASLDGYGSGNNVSQMVRMAKVLEGWGAGEILLQSVNRDGTMDGYDLPLIASVSREVSIPVIASGGCRDYFDMYSAIIDADADAVAAGALFQFTNATPAGAAEFLHNRGVEERL